MSDLIRALDNALAEASESFILRRVVGAGKNAANIDVTCRARVNIVGTAELATSSRMTTYDLIFSPTQINDAQWPGGTVPVSPPFNVDPRIPRGTDKAIIRGTLCEVGDVKPFIIAGELVRIEMRAVG